MERLTYNLHPLYTLTEEMQKEYIENKIKKLTDKLGKYEDLEEQIGCPLEVRCKIYDSNYVYTKDGEKWIITFADETHFIAVYDKAITHDRKFTYSDYKRTWWLKADRSE